MHLWRGTWGGELAVGKSWHKSSIVEKLCLQRHHLSTVKYNHQAIFDTVLSDVK